MKLIDEAKEYIAPTTKNIADLKEVDVDLELHDREGKDKDDEKFKYKVIVIDGEEYRVPSSVLGNLKAVLEKKPDLKKFAVSKQGTGMNTRYTVIPLD
ncbi:MAG: hypothetical protein ACTSXY_12310 [Promethearchaeota archaeon]